MRSDIRYSAMQPNNAVCQNGASPHRPSDAFGSPGTKLEEPVAQGAGMWHLEHGPEPDQKLDQSYVVRQNPDRPRLDLVEHVLVEVLDGLRHETRLAYLLTPVNPVGRRHGENLAAELNTLM